MLSQKEKRHDYKSECGKGRPKNNFINIEKLKTFAINNLPNDSVLRDLILLEPNMINVLDFCGKITLWLKMFDKRYLEGK